MAVILEPRQPPRLRLIGIDRKSLVVAATWMGDMIDAAAERAAVPEVEKVERQRRMRRLSSDAGPDGGFQALKRTPATASPNVAGRRHRQLRPLQVTTWRPGTRPVAFTCSRSTEESTKRTVPPATPSSPSTCHGSSACRSSSVTPPYCTEP